MNRCVFWFHPLAWWVERKLAILAEEACDEASLAATGDRQSYAAALVEMAEAVQRRAGGSLRPCLRWRASPTSDGASTAFWMKAERYRQE